MALNRRLFGAAGRIREDMHSAIFGVLSGRQPRDAIYLHVANRPHKAARASSHLTRVNHVGHSAYRGNLRKRLGQRACFLLRFHNHAICGIGPQVLFGNSVCVSHGGSVFLIQFLYACASAREHMAKPLRRCNGRRISAGASHVQHGRRRFDGLRHRQGFVRHDTRGGKRLYFRSHGRRDGLAGCSGCAFAVFGLRYPRLFGGHARKKRCGIFGGHGFDHVNHAAGVYYCGRRYARDSAYWLNAAFFESGRLFAFRQFHDCGLFAARG